MSIQGVAETQLLIKFVEKLPFTQKDKKSWLESLHENGIDDEVLEQVKEKFHKMRRQNLPMTGCAPRAIWN